MTLGEGILWSTVLILLAAGVYQVISLKEITAELSAPSGG